MTGSPVRLAIFDFDGTLTKGHLWLGIARHHKAHKIKRLQLYSYLVTHLPLWIGSKLKIVSEERNRARWGEDLSSLFKGFSTSQAKQVFAWVTNHYFLDLMREDILTKLKDHKIKGYKIVLLSGMFTGFLESIGEKLAADYIIGTKMEVKDNICTGKIIKPLCFGENKAKMLLLSMRERGLKIDFEHSYAYADSSYDLPVFKLVGNPVVAYPDKALIEIAKLKNWPVIGRT